MNQEKIGKFILELRKEKDMTQQTLADKLGVSDKTISKWENGRGMPDLSLMKPLCNVLGITINELLSGERLDKKDYQEKLEENILNTINYTGSKLKRTNKIFKIVIGTTVIIIGLFATMFCVDVRRMNQNKPVVFSTWGYEYSPAIDLHEEEIEIAIKNYLIKKSDDEPKHHENEKGFVSFRTYLLEEKEKNSHYNIYAWVQEEKYYLEDNEIKQESGSSIPYKFEVKYIDNEYVVTDSRIPRDGSLYAEDMKNIFPYWVRKDMEDSYTDGTIKRLKLDIQEQAKLYFHK